MVTGRAHSAVEGASGVDDEHTGPTPDHAGCVPSLLARQPANHQSAERPGTFHRDQLADLGTLRCLDSTPLPADEPPRHAHSARHNLAGLEILAPWFGDPGAQRREAALVVLCSLGPSMVIPPPAMVLILVGSSRCASPIAPTHPPQRRRSGCGGEVVSASFNYR